MFRRFIRHLLRVYDSDTVFQSQIKSISLFWHVKWESHRLIRPFNFCCSIHLNGMRTKRIRLVIFKQQLSHGHHHIRHRCSSSVAKSPENKTNSIHQFQNHSQIYEKKSIVCFATQRNGTTITNRIAITFREQTMKWRRRWGVISSVCLQRVACAYVFDRYSIRWKLLRFCQVPQTCISCNVKGFWSKPKVTNRIPAGDHSDALAFSAIPPNQSHSFGLLMRFVRSNVCCFTCSNCILPYTRIELLQIELIFVILIFALDNLPFSIGFVWLSACMCVCMRARKYWLYWLTG